MIWRKEKSLKLLPGKYCLINVEIVNRHKKINYYDEILFKRRKCCHPPPHSITLFELYLTVKFPLLRLLQFQSDLESTVFWGIFCWWLKILHLSCMIKMLCVSDNNVYTRPNSNYKLELRLGWNQWLGSSTFCLAVSDSPKKRFLILDQQIARYFVHYSKCLYHPPSLLCNSNNNNPFLTSRIGANHDKGIGF